MKKIIIIILSPQSLCLNAANIKFRCWCVTNIIFYFD